MTAKEIDQEFNLLKEYMRIYIQIIPSCIERYGKKIFKYQMPTFEYFKETYNDIRYSLSIPHYKESKTIIDNHVANVYTHGLGSENGIGYRYYNYWMGCKYFTAENIEGDYTIEAETINEVLKYKK